MPRFWDRTVRLFRTSVSRQAPLLLFITFGQSQLTGQAEAVRMDTLHGVEFNDPFYATFRDSAATSQWISRERRVFDEFRDQLSWWPLLSSFLDVNTRHARRSIGAHRMAGPIVVYEVDEFVGDQRVRRLYGDRVDGMGEELILDPRTLPGHPIALRHFSTSSNGLIAVQFSGVPGGGYELWIVDPNRGFVPFKRSKTRALGVAWDTGGERLFYVSHRKPDADGHGPGQDVFVHELGSDSPDRLLIRGADSAVIDITWSTQRQSLVVISSGPPGIIDINSIPPIRTFLPISGDAVAGIQIEPGNTEIREFSLPRNGAPGIHPLYSSDSGQFRFIGTLNGKLMFWTDNTERRGRLVRLSDTGNGLVEITRSPDTATIVAAVAWKDALFIVMRTGMHDRLYRYENGVFIEAQVPSGSILKDWSVDEPSGRLSVSFSSYYSAERSWSYDMRTGSVIPPLVQHEGQVEERFVTQLEWVPGPDGVRIPIYVSRRADLSPNDPSPVLLYAFGSWGYAVNPHVQTPEQLAWLELGGTYVVAGVRGGGALGHEWYMAGRGSNKVRSRSDLVAVGAYLKSAGNPVVLWGLSGGGVVVGSALTARPDLFDAAILEVARLDLFDGSHPGQYGDYDSFEGVQTVHQISAYHNLGVATCYPPTLIVTSDDDVLRIQSFKFVEAMRASQACDSPVLARVGFREGHLPAYPSRFLRSADILTFAAYITGLAPDKLRSPFRESIKEGHD